MLRKFKVSLNGKEYVVEMEEIGNLTGQTFQAPIVEQTVVSVPVASAPAASAPAVNLAEGVEVIAPMPGNILDVKVKVGDAVEENQVLLVLEAMKMENNIVAPNKGVVAAIYAVKGSAIDVGEVMVVIQ